MTLAKSLIAKVIFLTWVFLIIFFFLFGPEKPLTHTHDRTQELAHHKNHDDPEEGDTRVKKDNANTDEEYIEIKELQNLFEETKSILNDQEHSSGVSDDEFQDRIQLICTYYKDLCDKITLEWSYSLEEQYTYILLMLYSIKSIDSNRTLDTPNTLRNTLSSIRLYKNSTWRRWSAGTTHVNMNTQKIDSYKEFWEVFIHEVGGHILDLGVITDHRSPALHPEFTEFGEPKFGLDDWSLKFYQISWINENTRKPDASYKDFVSGYAMKDTFEELAEFANAWINHHDLLKEISKKNLKMNQKYTLFEELFGTWYFEDDRETLDVFNSDERVFDSTKSWKNIK